jgi:DNA-binding transcriptional LysR family regulator
MDFQRLTVFRAVARRLSFSRAAAELHLSQPAVSKHVRQLEAELGVPLFHRLGKRVELTDAGHIVADYTRRVFALTEDVRRVLGELEGLQRGYLRLGASATPGLYLLPEVLARFRRQYPQVETTLTITNSADIVRRVLAGELDLGFVGGAPVTAGLQVQPLADDTIVVIVPAGHSLARQRTFAPDLLARETLVVREAGSATRQLTEAHLQQHGLAPATVLEMTGCEGVKRAVCAGLGVAFISSRAITLELAGGLVSVPQLPELSFSRPLLLVTRKDARPSAASLAFLALLRKTV